MELLTKDTPFRLGDIDANAHILQHDHNHHLDQIKQLFTNAKAALGVDALDIAEQTLTELSTFIQHNLLSACLALRAYTCQRQQTYMQGTVLSEQYIEQNEHDPDGYLLAGNIRLLAGDYHKALQIYRTGMQHSSHGHPQYQQLVNETDHVEQQINYNNARLIRMLPPEVLYATLSFLKQSELAALASTCSVWHKLVLEWPGTWHEITIRNMDALYPGKFAQQFLARVPPQHVRKLSFKDNFIQISRADAYKEITRYNWNYLEELEIYCNTKADAHNYMERSDTAVSIIRNCKNTLKKLRIMYDHGGRILNYSLQNCPKLECLIFEDYDDFHGQDITVALPPGPFHLRHLYIQGERTDVDIGGLISKCHDLEIFRVIDETIFNLGDILRALCKHCPQLHTVEIGSYEECSYERPNLFPRQRQNPDNDLPRLRELKFHRDPRHVKEELTALLRHNRHSLEILDVQYITNTTDIYSCLVGAQLHNLRVLRCADDRMNTSFNALEAIIEASPGLQDVYIPQGAASDGVLAALGRLSKLTELTFSVEEPITLAGLDALFSHAPSLQKAFVIYRPRKQSLVSWYQTLRLIASCKPLTQLKIWIDTRIHTSDTEEEDFKRHVQLQRTNLKVVTILFYEQALPLESFLLWSNFKQLQRLDIVYKPCYRPLPWAQFASIVARMGLPSLKGKIQQDSGTHLFQLDSNGKLLQWRDDDVIV